jgi:hypothetical protein
MDEFQIGKPDDDKPIPFDKGKVEVSHAPLNLGGGGGGGTAGTEAMPQSMAREVGKRVSWPDRITGVKTFYTKLHPGAIEFLDEQVSTWLRDNPGVTIKHTNIAIGDVAAKKTEPNIIFTVWF